ncbi:multimodular transpeptidase-transglycosylase PBP 2A [Ligilactobacillus acidipiscis DSM 15836]|uniref:Multimodular transpeptidase-transglycosylase PBP 2A n=1 Tax=Ligilactobacillus acidipiscis DSM 15836 TaxID=1423716 RepID=A0ABR5PJS2_9LACO|nr:PBP1A family penicillin-binding protein [Ligilactobacillus acidipiscis]KRM27752.1 multimodular transpeptidase-transglycosylase PBP 2A [Ligilactobacillus acidipiscis DSM 15836]GAW64376.1 penicillin-binding protein 2A [Ligilactobacillus acidipiscis]GEN21259.1 carboxypeptidase [Ligilactobacillus acidipiscis]
MNDSSFWNTFKQQFKKIFEPFWHWLCAKWRRFQIWRWLLVAFLSIFLVASVYLVYIAKTTDVSGLRSALQQSTEVYDDKNQKAGFLYSQKGTWVSKDEMSKNVSNAVLSSEDRNFYHEYGFSVKGLGRAAWLLVKNKLTGANYISGGGSTLTQQLVKNAFLSQEQTFSRKAKEIFIAMQVENDYSKDDILTMYLNNAYFGNGVWGVEDAAQKYFGVHASQLSVPQSATLAGMLSNPGQYNPIDNPQKSRMKRNVVLQTMVENKKITSAEAKEYQATGIVLNDTYQYRSGYKYPYYFDAVINEATKDYGLTEAEIMNKGYKIYTSLNQNQQAKMQSSFADPSLFPSAASDGTKAQAGSIAIDPNTGGVSAVVGGRSGSHVFRGYNRGTGLIRSPGSTIKPLAVYTPAIESGYHYDSKVEDKLQPYGKNDYTPHNWDDQYAGEMRMYQALALSKNTSAVWLLNKIGVQKGFRSVEKFGIPLDKSDENLSLALGGLKKGVSPYQMASAYTAFANSGVRKDPHFITKIVDSEGKTVVDNTRIKSKHVMSKRVAKQMTSMMMDVYNNGTGQSAKPYGYTIAGKTGSTESTSAENGNGDDNDKWYIGYTPDVVVATWIGFDSTKYSIANVGTNAGSALFKSEMEGILPYTAQTSFDTKSASTRYNESVSGQGEDSSKSWDSVQKAGRDLRDKIDQGASGLKDKASSAAERGKQYLDSILGR